MRKTRRCSVGCGGGRRALGGATRMTDMRSGEAAAGIPGIGCRDPRRVQVSPVALDLERAGRMADEKQDKPTPKPIPKGKQIRKDPKDPRYDEASTFGKKWNW